MAPKGAFIHVFGVQMSIGRPPPADIPRIKAALRDFVAERKRESPPTDLRAFAEELKARAASLFAEAVPAPPRATSKYRGVSWSSKQKRFLAIITVGGKRVALGSFKDEVQAAKAYDAYALAHKDAGADDPPTNFDEEGRDAPPPEGSGAEGVRWHMGRWAIQEKGKVRAYRSRAEALRRAAELRESLAAHFKHAGHLLGSRRAEALAARALAGVAVAGNAEALLNIQGGGHGAGICASA
jgi:hypothetical protein